MFKISFDIPVSDKVAKAILSLSDLMRYTLNDSLCNKIKLKNELNYIQHYIDLYAIRFEPHFYIEFKHMGFNDKQEISPLLLIPFIENAFKHGVLNDPLNPVEILFIVKDNCLHFEVKNKISYGSKDISHGIGLKNIKRRLEIIYPNQHEFNIYNDELIYRVKLYINL